MVIGKGPAVGLACTLADTVQEGTDLVEGGEDVKSKGLVSELGGGGEDDDILYIAVFPYNPHHYHSVAEEEEVEEEGERREERKGEEREGGGEGGGGRGEGSHGWVPDLSPVQKQSMMILSVMI
ncbi:hypothetical protein ACOMHN_062997 [Nucella lapillus]